uniref:Uncharacterized protein LOC114329191 n=1 Tax=Diabrotica virgifera virgifera TaxID=50390 RepID=A0A6P7FLP5_DIAVI
MKNGAEFCELIEAKNELLKGKDDIIMELKAKEVLLYKNIQLLEEKVDMFVKKNKNSGHLESQSGNSGAVSPLTATLTYANVTQQKQSKTSNKSSGQAAVPQQNTSKNATLGSQKQVSTSNKFISSQQVSAAVMQAQTAHKIHEIQQLTEEVQVENNNMGWQQVRKRSSRRFVVGRNQENSQIKTVPKYVSLHVTRLQPGTKPAQLKAYLQANFSDVSCEEHESRHPSLYSSIKVTIRQEDLRRAWNREVWPSGALVSHFFQKRRVPQIRTDPQEVDQVIAPTET